MKVTSIKFALCMITALGTFCAGSAMALVSLPDTCTFTSPTSWDDPESMFDDLASWALDPPDADFRIQIFQAVYDMDGIDDLTWAGIGITTAGVAECGRLAIRFFRENTQPGPGLLAKVCGTVVVFVGTCCHTIHSAAKCSVLRTLVVTSSSDNRNPYVAANVNATQLVRVIDTVMKKTRGMVDLIDEHGVPTRLRSGQFSR